LPVRAAARHAFAKATAVGDFYVNGKLQRCTLKRVESEVLGFEREGGPAAERLLRRLCAGATDAA
jgi:hypothetical protein